MWHEVISSGSPAHFITLTYDEDNNPYGLSKAIAQKWLKRMRYFSSGQKIKYLLAGEYGDETLRPHYHCAVSGYTPSKYISYRVNRYTTPELADSWPYGSSDIEPLTQEMCRYVVKYITDTDTRKFKAYGVTPPFRLQSKGLGLVWLMRNEAEVRKYGYLRRKLKPIGLPRYYREKLDLPVDDSFLREAGEQSYEWLQQYPEARWEHMLAERRQLKEYDLISLKKTNTTQVKI